MRDETLQRETEVAMPLRLVLTGRLVSWLGDRALKSGLAGHRWRNVCWKLFCDLWFRFHASEHAKWYLQVSRERQRRKAELN